MGVNQAADTSYGNRENTAATSYNRHGEKPERIVFPEKGDTCMDLRRDSLHVDIMNATVPPHEIYRTHMLEIKLRLQRAEFVLRSPSPVTGLASLDAEFCFLQIRRIVEIITFCAALRDEARYKFNAYMTTFIYLD